MLPYLPLPTLFVTLLSRGLKTLLQITAQSGFEEYVFRVQHQTSQTILPIAIDDVSDDEKTIPDD